jgi:hypothetical protein
MANASIKSALVTFTFDDGEVETIEVQKQGRLDENTMPVSDSDGTFILDFQGVMKTIRLSGFLFDTTDTGSRTSTGTTVTIEDQATWLQNLVNGAQSGYTFNSSYQTNKKVYCRNFQFTEKAGDVARVAFVLELVEGA